MKRIWIMAALLALLGLSAQAATPATPIYEFGDYTYIFLSDREVQIVCWDGDAATLRVPEALDGYAVTSVSECAFADCEALQSVSLPGTVRDIGDGAFVGCVGLTRVELSEGLESIGAAAFEGCEALTRIALPATVKALGDNPFKGCVNLWDIEVSPENQGLYTVDGVLFSKADRRLVCFPGGNTAERYEVPEGVTAIGANAFDRDLYLQQVVLPRSLEAIGRGAFDGCAALEAMNLPASVTAIGEDALRCKRLVLSVEDGLGGTRLENALDFELDAA